MMSRAQVALLQLSLLGMTLTGLVFAWMKYFMKSDDPFAVVNHPWQPHMMTAHVLLGPVAVFAIGWVFGNHIWPAYRGGPLQYVAGRRMTAFRRALAKLAGRYGPRFALPAPTRRRAEVVAGRRKAVA